MSKHTPGPWHVSPFGAGFEIESATGVSVGQAHQTRPVRTADDHDERRANARLMAAAPELLEALKACAAVCAGEAVSKNGLVNALEKARDAIAKATGGKA